MDKAININPTDQKILEGLKTAILDSIGGYDALKIEFPKMIRKALDEVIDTSRTGRLTLDQTEKTEKTYIGTKVEILFRNMIGFPKGILDLCINGVDVDIKNTVGKNWTLPPEVLGKACVLISSNEEKALCNLGLIMVRPEYLSAGTNRDGKKTISKSNFQHIYWILQDHPYQPNFWRDISPERVKRIFKPKGGTDRLVQMFKEMPGIPIHRDIILGIAQQDDAMKRLRKNGGARDALMAMGMVVLSGKYNKDLIKALGLPFCSGSEFISYAPTDAAERRLLKSKLS